MDPHWDLKDPCGGLKDARSELKGPHCGSKDTHCGLKGPHCGLKGPHDGMKGPHCRLKGPHDGMKDPHRVLKDAVSPSGLASSPSRRFSARIERAVSILEPGVDLATCSSSASSSSFPIR